MKFLIDLIKSLNMAPEMLLLKHRDLTETIVRLKYLYDAFGKIIVQ